MTAVTSRADGRPWKRTCASDRQPEVHTMPATTSTIALVAAGMLVAPHSLMARATSACQPSG